MPHATFVVQLTAPASPIQVGGAEVLATTAQLAGPTPIPVLLQARAGSAAATALAAYPAQALLIASGDLALDSAGNTPVLTARVLCKAYSDQYLNEAFLIGRLGGEARAAESGKSCSRALAVNRYAAGEELTDWWRLRGYGWANERLAAMAKGALTEVTGMLELRTNKDGASYCELKIRTLKAHAKAKGASSGSPNPAAGTSAAGYSHQDLAADSPMPGDWT